MKNPILLIIFTVFMFLQSFAQPVNDDCANSILVTCGSSTSGSTAAATIDSPLFCGNPLTLSGPGVWYTFQGTGDAITASLCTSTYDTKIIVYSGSCGNFSCVSGNDDACFLQSETYFNSVLGTDYYILVTGYLMSAGEYTLDITCSAPCTPIPANDDCAGAEMLSIATDTTSCTPTIGTNTCATVAISNPVCFPFEVIQDVWYQFNTGTNTGVLLDFEAITAGGFFGYALSLSCSDTASICGGLSDGFNILSGLTANTTYFMQVFNNGGADAGSFSICLTEPPPAPVNDNCSSITPTTLVNGAAPTEFFGTTFGGTTSADELALFGGGVGCVWEAVTLTDCSDLRVGYCGTEAGHMANAFIVYTDCPLTAFTIGTWELTSCPDANVTTTFLDVPAGTYYLPVIVDPILNVLGSYVMNVRAVDCGTSGIDDISENSTPLVFPNPANEVLNISFDFPKESVITITDELGKIVLSEKFNSTLDISKFPVGIYVLNIVSENLNHVEKFVKVR